MNTSSVFLIAGIFIVAVGIAWVVTGGPVLPSAPAPVHTPAPVATSSPPLTITEAPGTTVPAPDTSAVQATATIPATPVTSPVPANVSPASTMVSGDDVRNHFLDIAFTPTNRLELIDTMGAKSRIIIATTSASNDDLATIANTVRSFNNASNTVKLSENVKETDNGDIIIRFLPEDGVNAIDLDTVPISGTLSSDDLTPKELYQGNVIGAKIVRGAIYLNANLKGDAKKHVIVRSLLYQMGLTGETVRYPDSVFYAEENTNVNITPVDAKAIAMLYNSGFTNGMSGAYLRQILYSPS